jgi:hypothetical protein
MLGIAAHAGNLQAIGLDDHAAADTAIGAGGLGFFMASPKRGCGAMFTPTRAAARGPPKASPQPTPQQGQLDWVSLALNFPVKSCCNAF